MHCLILQRVLIIVEKISPVFCTDFFLRVSFEEQTFFKCLAVVDSLVIFERSSKTLIWSALVGLVDWSASLEGGGQCVPQPCFTLLSQNLQTSPCREKPSLSLACDREATGILISVLEAKVEERTLFNKQGFL